jgi:protein-disulfide isomerase
MSDTYLDDQIVSDVSEASARPRRRRKQRPPAPRWPWFAAGTAVGVFLGIFLLAAIQSYTSAALPYWVQERLRDSPGGSTSGVVPGAQATVAGLDPSQPVVQPTQARVDPSTILVRDANAKGPASAPVLLVEYSDFQCPFCRKVALDLQPQLDTNYVDQGKVRVVFKHLVIFGQESQDAAVATECAADQGRFWELHDVLYQKQSGRNAGVFTKDNLILYAGELGLDMERFEPCLRNNETLVRVQADTAEAYQYGFQATPSFLIDGTPFIGAQPYEQFAAAIDAGLK